MEIFFVALPLLPIIIWILLKSIRSDKASDKKPKDQKTEKVPEGESTEPKEDKQKDKNDIHFRPKTGGESCLELTFWVMMVGGLGVVIIFILIRLVTGAISDIMGPSLGPVLKDSLERTIEEKDRRR